MITCVVGENCAKAWANGALAIQRNHGRVSPLVTEIQNPCSLERSWWTDLDPRAVHADANSLHSVVEMVAPDELVDAKGSRQDIYERAWRKYDRCRRVGLHLSNWRDTYFERLTRSDGINRIEDIITKMKSWKTRQVASFYAHTTSNTADRVVKMGNPCLQYIQFLQRPGGTVDLFAAYRNHDFFEKALGNYIGLGRVLSFVTRETGQEAGNVTCFSANAYLTHVGKVCPLATKILQ